jgi:hypothetical protein
VTSGAKGKKSDLCSFCHHVKGSKAPLIREEVPMMGWPGATIPIYCPCSCHRGGHE